MSQKPFLKWAGGKRWLANRLDFRLPEFRGKYLEPFLGSGAVFFRYKPRPAILSDVNERLIETYRVIRDSWKPFVSLLEHDHANHSPAHYYIRRAQKPEDPIERAAQFVYLNRACWNGLYRVNLRGEFNVPIGSKNWILSDEDDFGSVSDVLKDAELTHSDFETVIARATDGDLVFADPPYTVAHNLNGFVKYNESIFSWNDQIRLRDALVAAADRGAQVICTNADHPSVRELYAEFAEMTSLSRRSIISGSAKGRTATTELMLNMGPR